MLDLNCIFCKIANGNLPARIVVRSNKAIAFLDAFPLSAGHTLIIPSSHYSKIQDMDIESLFAVLDLLQKVSSAVEKQSRLMLRPSQFITVEKQDRRYPMFISISSLDILAMELDLFIPCLRMYDSSILKKWI